MLTLDVFHANRTGPQGIHRGADANRFSETRKEATMTSKGTLSADNNPANSSTVPISERARDGINMLSQAYTCGQDVGADTWDFALGIDALYESGLTISDLRWLVAKGFVQHGQESSDYGAPHRCVCPGAGYFFPPTTCVVLTADGAAFADHFLKSSEASSQPTSPIETENLLQRGQISELENEPLKAQNLNGSTAAVVKPCWDSRRRELSLDGIVIKRFRVPAQVQELILTAFEEEGWPEYIDDPLPVRNGIDPRARLHDAIHRLNRCQNNRLLRFKGNGCGTAVSWELMRPLALRRTMITGTPRK
jgi:hypothetical protein